MSAVAATLGNVGPEFGLVGPMGSYLDFSAASKVFIVGLMWFGPLEIPPSSSVSRPSTGGSGV